MPIITTLAQVKRLEYRLGRLAALALAIPPNDCLCCQNRIRTHQALARAQREAAKARAIINDSMIRRSKGLGK